ncbi:MAG: DUF2860 domain-containing protein [Aestuariibacter sp.]|nr:DUF2860 domain-containing protein [Aestuariibacter sp.]
MFSKKKQLVIAFSLVAIAATSYPLVTVAADVSVEDKYKEALYLRETGDTAASAEMLNGILSSNPKLHRARLELGVAYSRLLRFEEAKKEAEIVLEDPELPPQVRVSVLAFVAQMEAEQKKHLENMHILKPSISAGLMYDTNVNTGPDTSTIDISGGTLTLAAGSNPLEDWAYVVNAGLYHRYQGFAPVKFGDKKIKMAWETKGSLYTKNYQDYSEFNLDVVSLRTGPAFADANIWRANVGLQVDYIRLGSEKLGVFTSLLPSVTWRVKNGELTVDATLQSQDYVRTVDIGRDADYGSLGISYGKVFSEGKYALLGGVKAFTSDADNARFSNDGWEAFIGGNVVAWKNGNVFAKATYREAEYDGLEPVFNVARDEDKTGLLIGFTHEFKENRMDGWKLEGAYNRTENSSNVAIYDYEREIYSMSLNKSF